MSELILYREQLDKIVLHCWSEFPNEACGILSGKDNIVEKVYKMTNIDKSNVSYMMDPKEQFQVMKELRNTGKKMVAIYHSHPHSPAFPSAKDVTLAFYSDSIYLIVGLTDRERPEIRAFEIIEGKISEVKTEVRD